MVEVRYSKFAEIARKCCDGGEIFNIFSTTILGKLSIFLAIFHGGNFPREQFQGCFMEQFSR